MIRRILLASLVTFSALAGAAQAQPWGWGAPPPAPPPHHWAGDWDSRMDWERRMERREMRREFWRQQREIEARRAYEAGQRDAMRERYGQRW